MKKSNQFKEIFFSEKCYNLIFSNLILLASQSFIALRLSSKGKRGVDEKILKFNIPHFC